MPPDSAPSPAATAIAKASNEPPKRDAVAAAQLPDLYKNLANSRTLVKHIAADKLDPHTVQFNVGSTPITYHPQSREKLAEFIRSDAAQRVTDIEAQIKALGFEVPAAN